MKVLKGEARDSTARASERDLKGQIRELSERHRHLAQPDLFTLWFLIAFVTDSEQAALGAWPAAPRTKVWMRW